MANGGLTSFRKRTVQFGTAQATWGTPTKSRDERRPAALQRSLICSAGKCRPRSIARVYPDSQAASPRHNHNIAPRTVTALADGPPQVR
jgi:hypothetical protein